MQPIIFIESSAEAAAKCECEVIEENMKLWVEAVDALNASCSDFSKYYVSECDDNKVEFYEGKRRKT